LLAGSEPVSGKTSLKLFPVELNKIAVNVCPVYNLPATDRGLYPGLTADELNRSRWVVVIKSRENDAPTLRNGSSLVK
jgi:hypothetical protein